MKKILVSLISLSMLVGITGCKKDFLETAPSTSLSDATLKESAKGIDGILNGIHNMFYMYYFGQRFGDGSASLNVHMDFLSNSSVNSIASLGMGTHRWIDHRDPKGIINFRVWDYYYTIIQHTNTVLQMTEGGNGIAPEDLNRMRGQCHVIRAFCYNNLVQCFGKRFVRGGENNTPGVVLRLKPTIEPMPRSTVAECFEQINKDIEEGLNEMKNAKLTGARNSISLGTAYGIAARIALTQQDYAKAEEMAQKAIEVSTTAGIRLQVGSELLDGFNNYQASEWMWGYHQAEDQNRYFAGFGAHFSYNFIGGWNDSFFFAINRSFYDKMGANDIRRKWFVAEDQGDEIPADADPGYFNDKKWERTGQCIKFRVLNPKRSDIDQVMMRLGEMYYIKAEAQAQQGKLAEAGTTLNTVMITRDPNYTVESTLDKDALIKEIMRNKRIDLYWEGGAFYDMKRLGEVPDRLSAGNDKYMTSDRADDFRKRNSGTNVKGLPKTADTKEWEFAIPYDEIVGNKLCEQNPL
ncbi:RagB/SusD family nutrient uptake outer membrane protein [Porphyromonas cangingivalis]|uniref:Starch-binding associating with outer membrane n=1 Tax=Porphyromonas cangingivalis TaxID=36874 RepID=A0A1T4NDZ3_PORCN|nr:RagB/SusD family nutrient uptake outer membrane protein [Porphyromonas cangingivalis]SJZ77286.1 Starch-binding associating with outer membrane [Porphyromonas cangingivalis]SPY36102.1 SusD family [Porphyromonas cangingivalis]VEJ04766.1 SusD family [Porphyromonas cangingivalis]